MSLLLRYEVAGAWGHSSGWEGGGLARLGPTLDKLRDELCVVDEKLLAGELAVPRTKQPLGSAFFSLPATLLSQYQAKREASPLGQMLAVTKQLMSEVDQVVVIGDRSALAAPQAVMEACCQPFYNQLSRGERGSRPRLHFLGDHLDVDAVQGILHLIGAHRGRAAQGVAERWGIVVIGQPHWSSAHHHLLHHLLEALAVNTADDSRTSGRDMRAGRTIWIAGEEDPLSLVRSQLGSSNLFSMPAHMGVGYAGLSMIGLVPAALLGINVMKLLEGAQAVSQQFHHSKFSENLVLQLAGVQHLLDQKSPSGLRHWLGWNRALGKTSQWYRALIEGSLQRQLVTFSATDQVWGGLAQTGWCLQVFSQRHRFDPLVGLADARQQAMAEADRTFCKANWPTVNLSLPQIDEPTMGQLLQTLMLSTVIEARLNGSNPFASRKLVAGDWQIAGEDHDAVG